MLAVVQSVDIGKVVPQVQRATREFVSVRKRARQPARWFGSAHAAH